jgi:hypothetical protein
LFEMGLKSFVLFEARTCYKRQKGKQWETYLDLEGTM